MLVMFCAQQAASSGVCRTVRIIRGDAGTIHLPYRLATFSQFPDNSASLGMRSDGRDLTPQECARGDGKRTRRSESHIDNE
jgi:hypothetical protein